MAVHQGCVLAIWLKQTVRIFRSQNGGFFYKKLVVDHVKLEYMIGPISKPLKKPFLLFYLLIKITYCS